MASPLAACSPRHIWIVDPPYSRLRRSVIDLPYDIGFSPLFRNPHNKLSIISSNIYLEKVIRSSVAGVRIFQNYIQTYLMYQERSVCHVIYGRSLILVWLIMTLYGNFRTVASLEWIRIVIHHDRPCWECFFSAGNFFKSAAILNFVRNLKLFFAHVTLVIYRVYLSKTV